MAGGGAASGVHDPRKPVRPVMAVPGEQPDPIVFTLDDYPEPVVLHFMEPVPASRNLPARRAAGLKFGYWHTPAM
jgi:hypothetical protein